VIVPDYILQQSQNFTTWNSALTATGGINASVGSLSFTNSSPSSRASSFYRLMEQVNLPTADLYGISISNAILVGANLQGANLAMSDLSGVNLSNATVVSANLQNANLSTAIVTNADFSFANLIGATTSDPNLTGAILLDTLLPSGVCATDDPDAELIALGLSGQLLPQHSQYLNIRSDLSNIRASFPIVANIHRSAPWVLGRAMAMITSNQIAAVNASPLGPVVSSPLTGGWTSLKFELRYNPVVLVSTLLDQFGVASAQPDNTISVSPANDIEYNSLNSWYTFTKCVEAIDSTCLATTNWVFAVSPVGTVTLLSTY
jgi:hypothetical protein